MAEKTARRIGFAGLAVTLLSLVYQSPSRFRRHVACAPRLYRRSPSPPAAAAGGDASAPAPFVFCPPPSRSSRRGRGRRDGCRRPTKPAWMPCASAWASSPATSALCRLQPRRRLNCAWGKSVYALVCADHQHRTQSLRRGYKQNAAPKDGDGGMIAKADRQGHTVVGISDGPC